MWNNFKNKIKNLFSEEETEKVDQPINTNTNINTNRVSKKQLEARVTYQYPKRPFRFPVIPDERKERRPLEESTFNRSRIEEDHLKENRVQESQHVTSLQRGEQQQKQSIQPLLQQQVKKKQPFTPSEVPSPIYGFQARRRDQTIQDVPAFVRKQEEQIIESKQTTPFLEPSEENNREITASIEQIASTTELIVDDQAEIKDALSIDNEQYNEKVNERDIIVEKSQTGIEETIQEIPSEKVIEKEFEQTEQAPVGLQQETEPEEQVPALEDSTSHLTRDERRRAIRQKQKQQKKLMKQRNQKKQIKSKQEQKPQLQRKPIPFNVIMTPADKRKLSRKKKIKNTSSVVKGNGNTQKVLTEEAFYSVPFHLLNDPEPTTTEDQLWVENQQQLLEKTLEHFNVNAKVVHASQGPSVTRFEVQPELGVKVSKVRNLSDDIKMNMAAKDIRMEAPIPGKNTIGIEVPNLQPQMVGLQEILKNEEFNESQSPLTMGLGLNVEGLPLITNISKMPHGLIAGATGSGKSVCINTILISLIYKSSYEDVKLMLIDPKMVELAPYNDIPHLVSPVITDVKAATAALKWAVNEMESRYDKFVREGVRDIKRYNEKVKQQGKKEEKMPFLVIVIDELADLMMASPQDVEDSICRIAQKARACGIHLLLATQRPSVDVITGLIKANIPSRIAFSVSSQVDSRTIIDTNGAERLLGKGDMLFVENGSGKIVRLQGAFVSDAEIERVTNYVRKLASPNYLFEQEQLLKEVAREEEQDELFDDAVQFVFDHNGISTSLLQRQFRIGYNRAARLIDAMEQKGIISGPNGSRPREVLISRHQLEEALK